MASAGSTLQTATAQANGEQLIYEATQLHEDPPDGLINLPEAGNGQDQHDFDIPAGLMFSRWDVELLEMTLGAMCRVSNAPGAGETGPQSILVDWSYLPYSKASYRLRAYASPDGRAAPATIVLDEPNWLERAQDQVGQGVPLNVAIRGQKAKVLYDALVQHQNQSEAQGVSRAFFAGVDDAVIIAIAGVAIVVVLSIVVVTGMVTFGLLLKEAMDKGYDITDTRYTVATGEGESRQEHEMVFNLTRKGQ